MAAQKHEKYPLDHAVIDTFAQALLGCIKRHFADARKARNLVVTAMLRSLSRRERWNALWSYFLSVPHGEKVKFLEAIADEPDFLEVHQAASSAHIALVAQRLATQSAEAVIRENEKHRRNRQPDEGSVEIARLADDLKKQGRTWNEIVDHCLQSPDLRSKLGVNGDHPSGTERQKLQERIRFLHRSHIMGQTKSKKRKRRKRQKRQ